MEGSVEQVRAASAVSGVSLVIAGAGSGKTRTLVDAIGNAIGGKDAPPERILALTFSRKAAEEIRRRIGERFGSACAGICAGTIHSFCFGLVREFDESARGMTVLDEDTKKKTIMDLILPRIRDFLGVPAGVVCSLVLGPPDPGSPLGKRLAASGLAGPVGEVAMAYREYKQRTGALDFDDMISRATELLDGDAGLRSLVAARYRHVFVDEFQDISDADFGIIMRILPRQGCNLFVVGDDWQSIYGFRGSSIEYLVRMKKYFPGAVIHRLTANFRSKKEIVALANRFIGRNRFRTRKKTVAARGRGGAILRYRTDGGREEAAAVEGILAEERLHGGTCAVLFRNRWVGETLAGRLSAAARDGAAFMTMHASKGLEFDSVIVAGICDAIIPDREAGIEEERRLMYVALTRARDRLHLIARREESGLPGRFAAELGFRPD